MGRPSDWAREVTGRAPMRSPGAPAIQRSVERLFWDKIAEGLLPTEAGVAVGVSPVMGSRWFRDAGGMSPYSWSRPGGRYLSFAEREEIALLRVQRKGVRQIAQALGRNRSTISRELRRNAATRCGKLDYRASVAQWKAELFARRPKTANSLRTNSFATTSSSA
ncbi:MAG: Transposase for insertion sequence element [Nocardia sp.]|nr:Transposase for insertion sequence element [Nocardia sp.]